MTLAPRISRAFASFLTIVLCLLLAAYASVQPDAQANPTSPGATDPALNASWVQEPWSSAFTASRAHLLPAPQTELAGQPLDISFDNAGAAWAIGEFGFQTTRTVGGTVTRHSLPIKTYLTNDTPPQILGWTKPFSSYFAPHSSTSDLAESITTAGSNVWAAYGGEQDGGATDNHSILARYATDDPHNWGKWCAVPLPGDNNEVIGLAYDSKRGRVWFAESEGDHRQGSGAYTTIGWVKSSGLGSRCQNELDFGGHPDLSESQNDALRASAQQTVNSLQCTAAQDSDPNADCVHIIAGTGVPSGGTHIEYDPYSDALWMTNWCDRKLRKFSIESGSWAAPINAPPPKVPTSGICPYGVAWQVAVNGTHVFFNEYEGNRILRYTKSTGAWSVFDIPVNDNVETHSIRLRGTKLWFTVSDEDYNASTNVGYIDLAGGSHKLYTNWDSLPMNPSQAPGNKHSFRGIDVGPGGKIALADHGDMATVILTPK